MPMDAHPVPTSLRSRTTSAKRLVRALGDPFVPLGILLVLASILLLPFVARAMAIGGLPLSLC